MKILLDNVTKAFPARRKSDPPVLAVKNFSFEFPDGALVALLGPSGCGKSTTLNLISGLHTATEGRIFFGEKDVTSTAPDKRGVGMVFQNYALYPHLNVRQNIVFPLENLRGTDKLTKEERNARADAVARLVQIDSLMDRKPSELSGGQQQRVAIARALVKTPSVLLLDEPLSNLDARLRLKTREEIRRIQQETGVTTVFVTHDQDEAMSISDIIVIMKDGVVMQTGAPSEVYDNPENLFVARFIGTPPLNVFKGRIEGGALYIGGEKIRELECSDREVYVGIRPEGLIPNSEGVLTLSFKSLETLGRDVSIVSSHPDSLEESIRAIVDADGAYSVVSSIRFNIKENKLFVFDKESEERICF